MSRRKQPRKTDPPQAEIGRDYDNWLRTAAFALLVAQFFVPGVAAVSQGLGVIFPLLWLLLAGITAWLRRQASLVWNWTDGLLGAFLLLYLLSSFRAFAQGQPRFALNAAGFMLGHVAAFFVFRQLLVTRRYVGEVTTLLIGLMSVLSALGLEQAFVSLPNSRAAYEAIKDDPQAVLRQTGQWLPEGSPARQQFEARLSSAAPTATLALANSLGGGLAVGLILLVGSLLLPGFVGCRKDSPATQKIWVALAWTIPIALCLTLTHSRTAIVAAGCGLLVLAFVKIRPRFPTLLPRPRDIVLAIGVGATCLVTAAVLLQETAKRSLGFRFQYWQSTLEMIQDHPWLGCGPGQFQTIYPRYKLLGASEEVADPHNFILELVAVAGIPAGFLSVGFLIVQIGRGWKKSQQELVTTSQAEPATEARNVAGRALIFGICVGIYSAWLNHFALSFEQCLIALLAGGLAWSASKYCRIAITSARVIFPVAAGTLLIHLLGAGGISEPAIATLLMCLLAAAVADNAQQPSPSGKLATRTRFLRLLPALMSVLFGFLALCTYLWMYRPVVSARAAILQARGANAGSSLRDWERATRLDPYSALAKAAVADELFRLWKTEPSGSRESWVHAEQDALHVHPQSNHQWRNSAQRYWECFEQSEDQECYSQSLERIAKAIELYPTHAPHLLRGAKIALEGGNTAQAREWLLQAKRADDAQQQAGHLDKTLSPPDRQELLDLLGNYAN